MRQLPADSLFSAVDLDYRIPYKNEEDLSLVTFQWSTDTTVPFLNADLSLLPLAEAQEHWDLAPNMDSLIRFAFDQGSEWRASPFTIINLDAPNTPSSLSIPNPDYFAEGNPTTWNLTPQAPLSTLSLSRGQLLIDLKNTFSADIQCTITVTLVGDTHTFSNLQIGNGTTHTLALDISQETIGSDSISLSLTALTFTQGIIDDKSLELTSRLDPDWAGAFTLSGPASFIQPGSAFPLALSGTPPDTLANRIYDFTLENVGIQAQIINSPLSGEVSSSLIWPSLRIAEDQPVQVPIDLNRTYLTNQLFDQVYTTDNPTLTSRTTLPWQLQYSLRSETPYTYNSRSGNVEVAVHLPQWDVPFAQFAGYLGNRSFQAIQDQLAITIFENSLLQHTALALPEARFRFSAMHSYGLPVTLRVNQMELERSSGETLRFATGCEQEGGISLPEDNPSSSCVLAQDSIAAWIDFEPNRLAYTLTPEINSPGLVDIDPNTFEESDALSIRASFLAPFAFSAAGIPYHDSVSFTPLHADLLDILQGGEVLMVHKSSLALAWEGTLTFYSPEGEPLVLTPSESWQTGTPLPNCEDCVYQTLPLTLPQAKHLLAAESFVMEGVWKTQTETIPSINLGVLDFLDLQFLYREPTR